MLILDIGNSRCKWARVEAGRWTAYGVVDNAKIDTLKPVFARQSSPARILVSNVAGEAMAARLRVLLSMWPTEVTFIVARASQCGVRNSYTHPQQLGSDRWAALIGAWQRVGGACLVVNCGTATTLDALSPDGVFLGGLILPGVELMQHSLLARTALSPTEGGILRDFPLNTADALFSGAVRATQGAIAQQYNVLQRRYGTVRCLISGGAATVVLPQLAVAYEQVENLVLHGLQVIGESEA